VTQHIPFELVNKVQPEDSDRGHRIHGGAIFGEAVGALVAVDAFVGRAIHKGDGGFGGSEEVVKKHVDANGRELARVGIKVKEALEDGLVVDKKNWV
jgi:hypothetical protein